jgi:hypothetical protein
MATNDPNSAGCKRHVARLEPFAVEDHDTAAPRIRTPQLKRE